MENNEPKTMIKAVKRGPYTMLEIPSVVQDDDPVLLGARKLLAEKGSEAMIAAFNKQYPPKDNA
jgi:hypothetical protein